jgi:hypothetical protein
MFRIIDGFKLIFYLQQVNRYLTPPAEAGSQQEDDISESSRSVRGEEVQPAFPTLVRAINYVFSLLSDTLLWHWVTANNYNIRLICKYSVYVYFYMCFSMRLFI